MKSSPLALILRGDLIYERFCPRYKYRIVLLERRYAELVRRAKDMDAGINCAFHELIED